MLHILRHPQRLPLLLVAGLVLFFIVSLLVVSIIMHVDLWQSLLALGKFAWSYGNKPAVAYQYGKVVAWTYNH